MGDQRKDLDDTARGLRRAIADSGTAIRALLDSVQAWTERRGRVTQFVIAALISLLIRTGLDAVAGVLSAVVELLTALSVVQLLLLLIGVGLFQILLQARKFNQVVAAISTRRMAPESATDGGTNQPHGEEPPLSYESGPMWLAAFAGALIGATLCSSFATTLLGPSFTVSGAVFGTIMGAIYGNDFVKSL